MLTTKKSQSWNTEGDPWRWPGVVLRCTKGWGRSRERWHEHEARAQSRVAELLHP